MVQTHRQLRRLRLATSSMQVLAGLRTVYVCLFLHMETGLCEKQSGCFPITLPFHRHPFFNIPFYRTLYGTLMGQYPSL